MTRETEEEDIARRAEVLGALLDAMTDLRRELQRLTEQARSEESVDEPAAKQALTRLRDLLGQATKAEMLLDESRSRQAGGTGGTYTLDLDRARVDIGCKLDRLRRCGRPRAVPE